MASDKSTLFKFLLNVFYIPSFVYISKSHFIHYKLPYTMSCQTALRWSDAEYLPARLW
jgi:hypothetical protein